MNELSFCNDALLMQVLSSEDGCDIARELSDHVGHCIRCQNRLHELTATDEEWSTAFESLASETLTDDSADVAQHTQSWQPFFMDGTEAAWTEAQARRILSPPSHPEMLGRLGKYEIERWIGSGGMGIVFKGFDTELNRPVAIKVLAPHLAGSGSARQRFAREARAAAAVVHEHVVPIYSVDSHGESPFLVMQYVAGESLQKRLERVGPLETCEILRIAMQVASGLAAAHEQGLVHRDIKPANILLENGVERALITDFGLARAADDASLTNTGVHLGTPQYMSPEQACGEKLDARSDLFSLGSVIYAICTGRAPFRAENSFGVLKKIADSEPRPLREINPFIPIWLEAIVRKLHAKGPDQRYQTASEVKELLAHCLAHAQEPTSVPLPNSLKQANIAVRRWVGATVLVLALATIVISARVAWLNMNASSLTSKLAASSGKPGGDAVDNGTSENELNNLASVVSSMERDLREAERQLLGSGSIAKLLQHEATALMKGGPATRHAVSVATTGQKAPVPGDRIDLFVNIHDTDPTDPEVRPVVRSALVLKTDDPDPASNRSRSISLELELTSIEVERVQPYEQRRSFTYDLLTP